MFRKIKNIAIGFFRILKDAALNFNTNNDMKYSAALSYYTIFSIAPMLLLAISVGSLVFGRSAIEGHLFDQIKGLVGVEASLYIQDMITKISLERNSWLATWIGIGTLVFGATRVFGEIQSTINMIWGLKARPNKGIISYIFNRVLSFAMVLSIGFLLMVSLIASTVIAIMSDKLDDIIPETHSLMVLVSSGVGILIISLMFTLIFRYLPDSVVKWKDAFIGSLFTSVLFLIGKYVIGMYLATSASASAFGAAGSLIILLLWVYYSSILLYFGAEFTKSYAIYRGGGISPNKFSIRVEIKEIVVEPDDADVEEGEISESSLEGDIPDKKDELRD